MWHVLHAAPNCEPQVCKYLGLHGIDGYAPQFPPPARTKPGSVRDRKQRWVFPGYVFFKIEEGFSSWDLIRWAPGVRRMLQEDGAPATLRDEFRSQAALGLSRLRLLQDRGGIQQLGPDSLGARRAPHAPGGRRPGHAT